MDEVNPHPSADRMSIARIKGWNICVARDPVTGEPWCKVGQKVVYFPPDCIIPQSVAERHGVAKYLGQLPKDEHGNRPPGGRVRVANLRGFKSYGYTAEPDDPNWEVGTDVAEHYGITKYEPPVKTHSGGEERPNPNPVFHHYYDMENLRNFPNLFQDGEEVEVTEKLHGENTRLGLIREENEHGQLVWKWAAGTHNVRRKQFSTKSNGTTTEATSWRCFNADIKSLLATHSDCGYTPDEIDTQPAVKDNNGHDVILFGERYGSGVQDLWYGHTNGHFSFRAFDMTIDGRYLGVVAKKLYFTAFRIETVPEVWRGHYSFTKMDELSDGPTLVTSNSDHKSFREGIVITSVNERQALTDKKVMERAQLKCIGFTYLNRKEGTEYH